MNGSHSELTKSLNHRITDMNLTIPSFRKTLLVAALAACPLFAGQANAQTVTGNLFQTGTGLNSFTIQQGQQFQLTLQITTDFISSGVTYFLFHQQGFSSSNPGFQIVARDMSMSPYPDPTTGNATAFGGNAGQLFWGGNPATYGGGQSNLYDLGATHDASNTSPAGTYTIGILTINSFANLSLGTHTIRLDRAVVTDRTSGNFGDRPFTAEVTITVVPEPATVGMVAMGGGLLLVAAWRKRRNSVKA
jgi:hypothetical protein